MYKSPCKIDSKISTRGFSIVELIVAISIFVILSTTLLINYNTFNKKITLDTLAQQIALWVRDAQVSAMSVKIASGASGVFPGYGIHFDRATPGLFVYFADRNGNNIYDVGGVCGTPASECEKVVNVLRGNTISPLCGDITAVTASSLDCGTSDTSSFFDIVFTRPNPDAIITGNPGSGIVQYAKAEISVVSVKGFRRVVDIWTTGQISVR